MKGNGIVITVLVVALEVKILWYNACLSRRTDNISDRLLSGFIAKVVSGVTRCLTDL